MVRWHICINFECVFWDIGLELKSTTCCSIYFPDEKLKKGVDDRNERATVLSTGFEISVLVIEFKKMSVKYCVVEMYQYRFAKKLHNYLNALKAISYGSKIFTYLANYHLLSIWDKGLTL